MELFLNIPLWTAIVAIMLAQLIKIPLYYFPNKRLEWKMAFSAGGMPSSHSAAVTSLSTMIGIEYGWHSPFFAISCIMAVIVMFDAAGVRRHAGEQAVVLNQLMEDFHQIMYQMKNWTYQTKQVKRKKLKELLGHQPVEVLIGALFGIFVAIMASLLLNIS